MGVVLWGMANVRAAPLDTILDTRSAWYGAVETSYMREKDSAEGCERMCRQLNTKELRMLHCRKFADRYPQPTMHRECMSGWSDALVQSGTWVEGARDEGWYRRRRIDVHKFQRSVGAVCVQPA
jgi:hypothetical protein